MIDISFALLFSPANIMFYAGHSQTSLHQPHRKGNWRHIWPINQLRRQLHLAEKAFADLQSQTKLLEVSPGVLSAKVYSPATYFDISSILF